MRKRAGSAGKTESYGGLRQKSRALAEFRERWANVANLLAFRQK
jgi:hypothetical protein